MAIGAHPQNITSTYQHLWKLADDIWYYAGDQSLDYNFYTKRVILIKVNYFIFYRRSLFLIENFMDKKYFFLIEIILNSFY